jgi:hypothetical protein
LLAVALGVPLLFGWVMSRPGRGLSHRSRPVIVTLKPSPELTALVESLNKRLDALIAVAQQGQTLTDEDIAKVNAQLGGIVTKLEADAKPPA